MICVSGILPDITTTYWRSLHNLAQAWSGYFELSGKTWLRCEVFTLKLIIVTLMTSLLSKPAWELCAGCRLV